MAIRMVYNVPPAEVDGVKQMFMLSGASSVDVAPESDGEFTVIGIFPDRERHVELAARLENGGNEGGGG